MIVKGLNKLMYIEQKSDDCFLVRDTDGKVLANACNFWSAASFYSRELEKRTTQLPVISEEDYHLLESDSNNGTY